MRRRAFPFLLALASIAGIASFGVRGAAPVREPTLPATVDFNRDIRPILSENCYQCHGPDKNKRKAGLRLDTKEGLFGKARDVVPGKPEASDLYRRLVSDDREERMPKSASGKTLTARQIALVKRWIDQGAPYMGHWAWEKPVRPPVPAAEEPGFTRNAVDRFVLVRLREGGVRPSPEADRVTLIRRLSFDLLGLPPSPLEVAAFVADTSPGAYEKLVDRLLASPHYGERMAEHWLDLVRYADSIGYHSDNPMHVWPYRDYVINSFNANKPFDRFTAEQLGGDLMPNATAEQKVASCYNRLLQTTEEGGAQAKEYEAKYAADRVRNVSSVWLGATMGCCQCHDHKFDPFSTADFYALAAFFADVQEAAVGRREAGMPLPTPQQAAALKQLDARVAALRAKLNTPTPELEAAQSRWECGLAAARAVFAPAVALAVPPDVRAALAFPAAKRTPAQRNVVVAHYRGLAPQLAPVRGELLAQERQKAELLKTVPTCLVTTAGPPRTVRVLPRGNWQDESREPVVPAVPRTLPGLRTQSGRPTRLDLARWITSPDNPLTARVFVNRLWKLAFGQGISRSLEDLGSQGEWPTHPELLDWLAVEFRDCGWDVKHMVRLLVTSATYRQSSLPRYDLKEVDPYNRLLARQSRFRLDAETVRDTALSVSGLLDGSVGGPSVFPYQPAGYWVALNFPPREWQNDSGSRLYRRGLYTHWQRSFLHPSLLAFDAPSREECTVERPRSNIPQQALVLLNDRTYVEAARVLATRALKEGGPDIPARLAWTFEAVLSRKPTNEEVSVLAGLYARHSREFAADRGAAQKLLGTGARPMPPGADVTEVAAWTSAARAVLNLHETITRP